MLPEFMLSPPPGRPPQDRRPPTRRRRRRLGPVVLVAAVLAGCGGPATSTGTGGQSAARSAAAGEAVNLRGVCPATIVVQSSWYPQVEHGAVYQLLGKGYEINADRKRVSGPLVADGVDTGVRLEIRAGGPAIGSQQTSAQMYVDRSITIGMLNTDELIQQSASATPMLGVVAPLDVDPQVLAWDPHAHPDWNTISDIGQTDYPVLYYQGSPFMEYLIGTGILRRSQVDPSYDGTPGRFVTDHGQDAVQAYATNEPFAWWREEPRWGKQLAYALVYDTGYPNYANVLGIRSADRTALNGCLRKLVPIIQAAQVAFAADPSPAIEVMLAANVAYHGFHYDRPLADYAVATMLGQGIVGNGGNRTLGDFDHGRISRLITILTPIFAGQKKPVKDGLGFPDLVTNDYIDQAIGLPTSK
jgi:hypothetical protein